MKLRDPSGRVDRVGSERLEKVNYQMERAWVGAPDQFAENKTPGMSCRPFMSLPMAPYA